MASQLENAFHLFVFFFFFFFRVTSIMHNIHLAIWHPIEKISFFTITKNSCVKHENFADYLFKEETSEF